MAVASLRPSRVDALNSFLTYHLADKQKDLDTIIERINGVLAGETARAPVFLREIDFELRLRPGGSTKEFASSYAKRTNGRAFMSDFTSALAQWLTANYWLKNQPDVFFEVLNFDGEKGILKVTVNYLARPEG